MSLLIKIVGSARYTEEEVMSNLTNPLGIGKKVWCYDPNADVNLTSPYYDINDGIVKQKEWSVGYKLSHGTTVKELLKEGYYFYFEIDSSFFSDGEEFAAKVLDSEAEVFEFKMNLN